MVPRPLTGVLEESDITLIAPKTLLGVIGEVLLNSSSLVDERGAFALFELVRTLGGNRGNVALNTQLVHTLEVDWDDGALFELVHTFGGDRGNETRFELVPERALRFLSTYSPTWGGAQT